MGMITHSKGDLKAMEGSDTMVVSREVTCGLIGGLKIKWKPFIKL